MHGEPDCVVRTCEEEMILEALRFRAGRRTPISALRVTAFFGRTSRPLNQPALPITFLQFIDNALPEQRVRAFTKNSMPPRIWLERTCLDLGERSVSLKR
jgi:hypothetical protein